MMFAIKSIIGGLCLMGVAIAYAVGIYAEIGVNKLLRQIAADQSANRAISGQAVTIRKRWFLVKNRWLRANCDALPQEHKIAAIKLLLLLRVAFVAGGVSIITALIGALLFAQ